MLRHRIVLAVVAAAACVVAIVFVFSRKTEVDVTTATVSSGTIVRRIFATGTLQASRTVDVGTQVSGVIASLGADFNSIVYKGQVVARIDPSLYQAATEQAKATLAQSDAALRQANADLS